MFREHGRLRTAAFGVLCALPLLFGQPAFAAGGVTGSVAETVLHSFGSSNADGLSPYGAMIQGTDGNFYGTTRDGGAYGYGTVYRVTPAGVETILHSFGATTVDPEKPDGALAQGSDGNFYGLANGNLSGTSSGFVYKITPAGAFTTIYAFPSGGIAPSFSLIQGSDGNVVTAISMALLNTVVLTRLTLAPALVRSSGSLPQALKLSCIRSPRRAQTPPIQTDRPYKAVTAIFTV